MTLREVFNKRARGSVSVFFVLLLSLILSLLFALHAGIRKSTCELQIEYAMNASMNAVFAEYHRQLLEQYDLLAIDTSYGTGTFEVQNTAEHLRRYMQDNFGGEKDLLGMTAADAEVLGVTRLTDGNGRAFEKQVINYMHTLTGLPEWESSNGQAEEYERQDREIPMDSLWQQAGEELSAQELPQIQNETGEWENVSLENPADAVAALRSLGILRLTVEDLDSISNASLEQGKRVSDRSLRQETENMVVYGEPLAADKLLFKEYLFQKMGCYTRIKENSALKYQLEYLLNGDPDDYTNLEKTANKLCMLRFLLNYQFLSGNPIKKAEIKATATALTAVTLKPELEPFVSRTLMFAWAYVESVQDVKQLLAGGKIPWKKTDADWQTQLVHLAEFNKHLSQNEGGRGMDYVKYLRIFVCLTADETLAKRAMDLVESDIQQTPGNEKFQLDGCVIRLDAGVSVEDGAQAYFIRRKFSYETMEK